MVTEGTMANDRLPSGLWRRGAATARIAARVGRSAARRLVTVSALDDAALGESLLRELDHLKGSAMKVGQILSYMDVGLPPETVRRLEALQEGVQPLDAGVVRAAIEAELGRPVDELFDDFDDTPVAAASIGQVHRASVGGLPVAVKVRYPGIEEVLRTDVRQLQGIARIASLGVAVDGPALVAELEDRLLEECDYRREAGWQRAFGALGLPGIHVPEVVDDRCARGVLTTAWANGMPLLSAPPEHRAAVAPTLANLHLTSLFGHGVLHADPHPGNLRVRPDGEVVLLDFGCVRAFGVDEVARYRALFVATLDGDRVSFRTAAVAAGLAPRPERIDWDEMLAM
jgi:predicted unusual protein kinase regulating ubiquinone biosynthesis (AarF/ABC1/UbiB family)